MEDALRDSRGHVKRLAILVLLLVLMEDALRVSQRTCISQKVFVLILVLMEDALRELNLRRTESQLVTVPFSKNPLDF